MRATEPPFSRTLMAAPGRVPDSPVVSFALVPRPSRPTIGPPPRIALEK
jgi:hypothetical protein